MYRQTGNRKAERYKKENVTEKRRPRQTVGET
jgi:hypothetical protein